MIEGIGIPALPLLKGVDHKGSHDLHVRPIPIEDRRPMPLRVLLQAVGREIHEGVEMLHIELILVELHCLVPGLAILS